MVRRVENPQFAISLLATTIAGAICAVRLAADEHDGHAQQAAAQQDQAHAAAGDGIISLDLYADGATIHLLTAARRGEDPVAVRYRRLVDGDSHWTEPVQVAPLRTAAAPPASQLIPPSSPRRGNDIQLAASGPRIVAVWQQAGTGFHGSGPMVTAVSSNGGQTWKPGPNPADDGSTSGHGFIDILADSEGTFHLVWLDSRSGRQGLRYARSTDGGASWSKNLTLDDETCECCWNTLAAAPGGRLSVLYRDKHPRDMAVVCSGDGGKKWSHPVTAGSFLWDIEACPHAGGGLAFLPGQHSAAHLLPAHPVPPLHAIVWTGGDADAGSYHLTSRDGGASWSKPRQLGGDRSSHPDLTAGHGAIAVVWHDYVDGENIVVAALSRDSAASWSSPRRLSAKGARAGHPRVVATATGFYAVWSEQREGKGNAWNWRRLD